MAEGVPIKMPDSWGDGWNGNTLTLNGVVYGADFTSGTLATAAVSGDCGFGCTEEAAENYDASATLDDGSCTMFVALVLLLP